MISKKSQLIEQANKRLLNEEYGGNEFELPPSHQPGMRVTKGGSCCANCKYWNETSKLCTNKYYIKWNGDDKIPAPADEFCSDWWEAKK
jgi:hypothetical protein